MLTPKITAALAAHGSIWSLDMHRAARYMPESIDVTSVATGQRRYIANPTSKTPAAKLPKVNGAVAVIPIAGLITRRGDWFSGGTDRAMRAIDAAQAQKAIAGIVLDIDSPGGSSYGTEETSERIFKMRGGKPLIAVANSMACSAAYHIGTAADQLVCTPSGDVGSIGVYCLHMDYSGMLEQDGVKPTFIFAGQYKTEGNPYEPLSEEARDEYQRIVDDEYQKFVATVARNRGVSKATVLKDFGEGRAVPAAKAKAAGMVDRVASLEEVLEQMGASRSAGGASVDRMEVAELERVLLAAWNGTSAAAEEKPDDDAEGPHVDVIRRRRERERRGREVA